MNEQDSPPPLWRHAVDECNEAHVALDRHGAPATNQVRRVRGPDGEQTVTIGLAARIDALVGNLRRDAPPSALVQPEVGWFNQVCAALGLFDGARPVPVSRVMWDEVLPAIEALKTNNPEAGVIVRELERAQRLWREALAKQVEAHQEHEP